MNDKETENNVFDILDKMEFFQGQRAGRELWNDKPKEVQDKDIADFVRDINYIRSYLQNSVVLSKGAYESLSTKAKANVVNAIEIRKETAKKLIKLIEFHSISRRDKSGYETFTISNLCMREILREQFGFTNEKLETMWEIKE